MGTGTGQKLRSLESKDVSFSVSWWLERLTTVGYLYLHFHIGSQYKIYHVGSLWFQSTQTRYV
jgi:hypothetical protein